MWRFKGKRPALGNVEVEAETWNSRHGWKKSIGSRQRRRATDDTSTSSSTEKGAGSLRLLSRLPDVAHRLRTLAALPGDPGFPTPTWLHTVSDPRSVSLTPSSSFHGTIYMRYIDIHADKTTHTHKITKQVFMISVEYLTSSYHNTDFLTNFCCFNSKRKR